MTWKMTRRSWIHTMTAAGIITSSASFYGRHAAGQPVDPQLGDTRDIFASSLGAGTEIEGGLVQFGTVDAGEPVYYVRFHQGAADSVEIDLTSLPGGGLDEEEAQVGDSTFLPDDAERIAAFSGGALQFDVHAFNVTAFHSTTLQASSGRSGNVLNINEHGVAGDGASGPAPYERAIISMEMSDVLPVTPHGEGPVLMSSLDDWWAEYGQAPSSQRAAHVEHAPLTRMYFGTNSESRVVEEIDIVLAADLPVGEAIDYIGQFLPSDASLEQTYFGTPTPTGPRGLRTNVWVLPEAGVRAVTLLFINGSEEIGTVSRMLLAIESQA